MKRVKEFLRNVMIVEECKYKIQEILSRYPEGSGDQDLSIDDLKSLIELLQTTVKCNELMKVPDLDIEECLESLQYQLKTKQP